METETATVERQGPGSGCSFIGDRAGLAQQRACGPCRATHDTPTCSAAGVRPGPGMPAVDVADPADGQRPGWVYGFGLDGFSTRTGVRNSTWPAWCVLFAECTAQVTDGQSTFVRVLGLIGPRSPRPPRSALSSASSVRVLLVPLIELIPLIDSVIELIPGGVDCLSSF